MRHKLLTILAATFTVGGVPMASAADMAMKAPPPAPVAAYNWSGWYVGGNVGYGWGVSSDPNLSFADPFGFGLGPYFAAGGNVTPDLKPDGVIGGGQIGFNWMPAPHWVTGLVADFQGSGISASATNTVAPAGFITTNQFNSEKIDWFGTLRAKLGFAQNNWLFYGTGGMAYGRVATNGSLINLASLGVPAGTVNFSGSDSTTKVGWAAGAGLDYALTSNWIIGIEYLYVDLGRVSYSETDPAAPGDIIAISNRAAAQIARASLDYKF